MKRFKYLPGAGHKQSFFMVRDINGKVVTVRNGVTFTITGSLPPAIVNQLKRIPGVDGEPCLLEIAVPVQPDAGNSGGDGDSEPDAHLTPPKPRAPKDKHVAFAARLGLDTEGMSTAALIKAYTAELERRADAEGADADTGNSGGDGDSEPDVGAG